MPSHAAISEGWIVEGPRGAAQLLNLKPSTLRYRMQKLGIGKPAR
ncbi:helix-turn-helix domain-containing protein [Methylomonas montana]|nr:helix-turn-helix domain-containing protein [Methylomonas montana]WKJ92708.1 helix-turn-helix domain-containing protein [Methylomonas montana]